MVRRNRNTCSMLLRQMIIQGFNTGHMVWMEVRKNNLAHDSSLRDQIIDAGREGNLFVFIRRAGIDYQDLARVVNQITVSVSGWGLCRRAQRKANVVGMELDATCRLPPCLRHRKKSFGQIIGQASCQRLQRMQYRRYRDNFTALPFRIGITRANPLAALQLRIFRYFRMLLCRTGSEKKPRVKTTGRKGRSHPAPNEGEVIGVEMQSVKVE